MNKIQLNNGQCYEPSKIICVGRNYHQHIKELNNAVPDQPVIFLKPNSSITDILAHEQLHFEAELCFLILNQRLAAVGLGLDLTKRELQHQLKTKGLPWERSKAFDGSALFSPFIALDQLEIEALSFTLQINGQQAQLGRVKDMIFKPEFVLEDLQTFMSFEDGDVLMTGTPEGVGSVVAGAQFELKLYESDQLLLSHSWQALA